MTRGHAMSAEYGTYHEGLIEDEWTALGPWFKVRGGSFHLDPMMSGRSSVRMMLQDLSCNWEASNNVSPDVRKKLVCAGCTVRQAAAVPRRPRYCAAWYA